MKPIIHTSDTGLGILSVLERANQEIRNLRKAKLSYKSRYWKPVDRRSPSEVSKSGVSKYSNKQKISRGLYDEWTKGYEYFCDQTVNTKGHKVNRKKLKAGILQKINYGKNDNKFD
tara:strand:- start:1275 stop:1622 length:348 start_codon:yes stop_codon:yes gene_type:complete